MARYRNIYTGQIVQDDEPDSIFLRNPSWTLLAKDEPAIEAKQAETASVGDETPDLSKLKRGELDKLAAEIGVDEPEKIANAGEVIKAIEAKQAETA